MGPENQTMVKTQPFTKGVGRFGLGAIPYPSISACICVIREKIRLPTQNTSGR